MGFKILVCCVYQKLEFRISEMKKHCSYLLSSFVAKEIIYSVINNIITSKSSKKIAGPFLTPNACV